MVNHPVFNRSGLRSFPSKDSLGKHASRLWLGGVKIIVACVVVALANTASAQKTDVEPKLVPGSEVNLAAITGADWIQGEGPTAFEPGKVYMFECWATWCGPCVALIPHVNELHKKYYDQGLRVHGMNSWEEDKKMVVDYVKAKGEGMSYPVAFTNESAFQTEWLEAAGVESIPHAFVVRNGKLLLATPAVRITDSLVELMLSGDEGAKKAAAIIQSAHDAREETDKLSQEIYRAKRRGNAEKMAALINKVETLDPGHYNLAIWNFQLLVVRKDWPAALAAFKAMPPSNSKTNYLSSNRIGNLEPDAYPMDLTKAITAEYADYITAAGEKIGPSHLLNLTVLYWRTGEKEKALTTADKALEVAINFKGANEFRTGAYTRFVKSIKAGNIPKPSDVTKWHIAARDEAKKKAEMEKADMEKADMEKAAEGEPKAK